MSQLADAAIGTKVKLCALWTSIVFCGIYTEYFALHRPATLEMMKALGADPEFQLIELVRVAIPILMIFLSVALPATLSRILNIVGGLFYILQWAIIAIPFWRLAADLNGTFALSPAKILQLAAAAFAVLVVLYAFTWPKSPSAT